MAKKVVVIGGGPGGYVAAIRAAQLGCEVSLIEKDKIGGTCLNRGCIPTKTLYRNAEILNTLKRADEFGIEIENFSINAEKIQQRKNKVVMQLVSGIEHLIKANKIELLRGEASIKDKNTVLVSLNDGSHTEITCDNIIIATGSRPVTPPIPGALEEGIYKSEEILNFKDIPKELAIIGGGVIGMEFASIFSSMGTKVTVIEFLPSILASVDSDLVKRLMPSLKKKGMNIYTSAKVTKIEKEDGKFTVFAEGKKGEIEVQADSVLIATGRAPIAENLNLDGIGIEYGRKGIKVDENYETNVKGIYAIGDATGKTMLAHAASHAGITAAEHIMGINNTAGNEIVPACIFVFPEIAYCGMTEEQAKEKGIDYKVSKFMFGANGKALALGEPEGLVKVIARVSDNVLIGVHIMGPHASDIIHEAVLAVSSKMKAEDITKCIHAHPTLSEAFYEAVSGISGKAIHAAPRN